MQNARDARSRLRYCSFRGKHAGVPSGELVLYRTIFKLAEDSQLRKYRSPGVHWSVKSPRSERSRTRRPCLRRSDWLLRWSCGRWRDGRLKAAATFAIHLLFKLCGRLNIETLFSKDPHTCVVQINF